MIVIRKMIIPMAIGAISAGTIVTWYLHGKRNKVDPKLITLAKAAIPDQLDIYEDDHFENTKMMSEGSHYGIDYYNERR